MPPKKKLQPLAGQKTIFFSMSRQSSSEAKTLEKAQTTLPVTQSLSAVKDREPDKEQQNSHGTEALTQSKASSDTGHRLGTFTKSTGGGGIGGNNSGGGNGGGDPENDGKGAPRKFQQHWFKVWDWLELKNEKMYCKLCTKAGKDNTFTMGCVCFKTSSMNRHELTSDHKASIAGKALKPSMDIAIANVYSEEDRAVTKAMKVVYWLASENLPLSKYESLMGLLKELEVPGLDSLTVGNVANYESYCSATEMLTSISDVIDDEINEKIEKSPYISLLCDESTDITNTKRMTITAKVVDPDTSVTETLYLRDLEYESGTGEGISTELLNEMKRRDIQSKNLMGLGTDGASTMTGVDKGVAGRMKEKNPHLVNIHCMAHRLALCTSQAANAIPVLKRYQQWLTSLFYYFKASPTREQELHKVQSILNHPKLKYKEIHSVRWLSFYDALEAVHRTIDPLITYMHQRKASKDPKAKGLLKKLATTQFIYTTYLLMDVIPIVSKLCLTFQKEDLDVATAKLALDLCLADLEAYRTDTQTFKTHIEEFENDVQKIGDHHEYKGHRITASNTKCTALKNKFLNKLIANIQGRFPRRSLLDSFFVLALRSIHHEPDPATYGNDEIEDLLRFYGEEQIHKQTVSPPVVSKTTVLEDWRLAKTIVAKAKYPTNDMAKLWELLTTHHKSEIPEIIKLGQLALTLPLHTAGCERVFSQQNIILTKLRNRLLPTWSDKLLRIRLEGKGLEKHDFKKSLMKWHSAKRRRIKTKLS